LRAVNKEAEYNVLQEKGSGKPLLPLAKHRYQVAPRAEERTATATTTTTTGRNSRESRTRKKRKKIRFNLLRNKRRAQRRASKALGSRKTKTKRENNRQSQK
jgi:hypothetical protein